MTRKTSAYSRKRQTRAQGYQFDGTAWVNVIQRCRPFQVDEAILPGLETMHTRAQALLLEARSSLEDLLSHRVEPANSRPYDCLANVVDVAYYRSLQIDRNPDTNPAHATLASARMAMHGIRLRYLQAKRWGMNGPEREALKSAVDLYEAILLASSPQQMHDADTLRAEVLAQGNYYTPGAQA